MRVTVGEFVLGPDELHYLDSFLKSTTGRRVVQAVAAQRPPSLGDPFAAGRVAGYEEAINTMLDLVGSVPQITEDKLSNYPDLDDDHQWKDDLPEPNDDL